MTHPPAAARGGVLYLTYDGLLEPLGQSQVLAYQERLAREFDLQIVSFEKAADWRDGPAREAIRARVRAAGIGWHPRRYHKRPSALATGWDVDVGIATGLWLIRRHGLRVIHARSYVPAAMALALKRLTGARFLFDMRGLWADERVDGGLWAPESRIYRLAKRLERRFLRDADRIVSLTRSGVEALESLPGLAGRLPPISVIPTCTDLDRFRPPAAPREGFVVGYVGSAGTWYAFDTAVACFAELRRLRPEARLLVLNRNEHAYVRERLRAGGVPLDRVEIRAVPHREVPEQIARMRTGLFFYKPTFSRRATSPTRLGEFLGCGVPCLGNHGVGDVAELLEGERVGVALRSLDPDAVRTGVARFLALLDEPDLERRCVETARRHLSLEEGVARYRELYRSLTGGASCGS